MIYLLALIGAVAVVYLVWKAFGPQGTSAPSTSRGPIGPDDDTDFLLDLGNDGRTGRGDRRPGPGTPTAGPDPHEPRDDRGDDGSTDGTPHRDDPRPGATN